MQVPRLTWHMKQRFFFMLRTIGMNTGDFTDLLLKQLAQETKPTLIIKYVEDSRFIIRNSAIEALCICR